MLDQAVQRFCAAAARFSVRRGWSGDVEVARTPCLVIKVAAALGLAADGCVVQGEVGGLGAHGNAVPAADTTDLPPTDGAGRQRRKTVPRFAVRTIFGGGVSSVRRAKWAGQITNVTARLRQCAAR